MHERYGPIVRINPDELHCSDPLFTGEIYAGTGRIRDRRQHRLNTGGAGPISVTVFSTVPHELHRLRRGALNQYFSRQQMLKLEGEVYDFAQLTVDKMLRRAGGPFDIKDAFNCFTADVISHFFRSAYMMRHNALARKAAQFMPLLAEYMGEDVRAVMRVMNVTIPTYIRAALVNPENGRVFADLVGPKSLPEEERSIYRLSGEGFNFLLAGTETTAATLAVITYHLLDQPAIYKRLTENLQGLSPLSLKWISLEQPPYLWSVIQESLRMMPGVSRRSARIARDEDLAYKSQDGRATFVIPREVPIGMTSMINHWDKKLFPDPDRFVPERWLLGGKPNLALQKYLISFGKGSRSCIGKNLAYCEIYLMAALMAFHVIPRARLFETTVEDISYHHDQIVAQTKKGSISVKITIS